ncbi:hypothetical protein [Chryseosolibacter indicus]|uniref:Oxidase n=1 Tax=Chryseosolibacter indicus TaxID=2782351 RepID=A0ABS5VQA2_9BACT|nr:hypothetical protein [Chryseosolibacter indicus]MBT1702964.1 hypothetical protein [Chryseosolibacter indicus]
MKDFLLDFENKRLFENGDIRTGESDNQNKHLLIVSEKASFKEFPATCVGAANYLESEDVSGLLREVRSQFTADGMTVNKVLIEDGKLKVDADY